MIRRSILSAFAGFALLSEALWLTGQRLGSGLDEPIHRFHCPMAFNNRGANWLQTSNETENPYFGAAMYRCGTLEEALPPSFEGE